MTIQTSTLRPGLLVSLKTSVRGNVSYQRRDIIRERVKEGKAEAKWETERVITDVQEHEAASLARSKAIIAIRKVCAQSAFGLLCPEQDAEELEKAIAEARSIVDEFNATATLSRVRIYIMTGRVAADDVEAVRAINSEVSDLLKQMQDGVKNLDVKAVRDAANKARAIGSMLSEDASLRIQGAIEAARKAARQMVKSGDQAAQEIDKRTIRKIAEARTAFLDLDDAKEIAAPKEKARALDFVPEEKSKSKSSKEKARSIELD